MNRCLTRITLVTTVTLCGVSVFASGADATFHQNLIREVHETGVNGDYVVLQAYASGENFVSGHQVVTYDGGGNPISHVVLSNVLNGANQATILVGDTGVPDADATDPDFNVVNNGGAVCYANGTSILIPPTGIDCVAYAGTALVSFPDVPPASPYGSPASIGGPDLTGESLIRSIGRGCPTALDAADDSNNSAADFALGPPIARNNAATPTETVCPPGNPNSPTNPAGKTRKRKCKKKQKRSAEVAKKKKCKKKKH
jgi:hypothetical protein